MDIKNILVTLVLSVIASVGIVTVLHNPVAQQKFGSLAGPDIPFPYLRWGGVQIVQASQSIAATSSIVCAIQAPTATSSINFLTMRLDSNGLGSAQTMDVSTSTTAFASSSPALILANSIPSGANTGTPIVWTGTAATTTQANLLGNSVKDGTDPYVVYPNQWITWRLATSSAGTFATYMTGTCQASFTVL